MIGRDGVFSEQLIKFHRENIGYYYAYSAYRNRKSIVRQLQNINDPETIGYFKDYYIRRIKNRTSEYSDEAYLLDLKSTGHTDFTGLVHTFIINTKNRYVRNASYLQELMNEIEMPFEQQINEVKLVIENFEKNKALPYTSIQLDGYKELLAELERRIS